jgi:hypothetical protein
MERVLHADEETAFKPRRRGSRGIGPAGVRVADVGREEFEEAHRRALDGDGTSAGGGERATSAFIFLPPGNR